MNQFKKSSLKLSYLKAILIILCIYFISFKLAAATTVNPDQNLSQAIKILEKYNSKNGCEIKLELLTDKKALGTQKKDKGVLTYQTGKLHLLLEGEKKSEIIYDGSHGYLISYPDQDLDPDGNRKVVKIKSEKGNHLQILTKIFSQPKAFFAGFKVTSLNAVDDKSNKNSEKEITLNLEDKNKKLKSMKLIFSKSDNTLSKLSYSDDVSTETQISFEKPRFLENIPAKLFKYNALKTDVQEKQ